VTGLTPRGGLIWPTGCWQSPGTFWGCTRHSFQARTNAAAAGALCSQYVQHAIIFAVARDPAHRTPHVKVTGVTVPICAYRVCLAPKNYGASHAYGLAKVPRFVTQLVCGVAAESCSLYWCTSVCSCVKALCFRCCQHLAYLAVLGSGCPAGALLSLLCAYFVGVAGAWVCSAGTNHLEQSTVPGCMTASVT
jgi:hypothetical protein